MESFFSKKSGSSNSAGQPALAASDPSVAEDEEKIKQEEKCKQEEGQGPESMGPGMTLQQANAQIRQWKAERGQAQAKEEEEQEEEQEEQEEQEEEEEEEAQQVEKEGSAEQLVVQSKCLKDVRLFRRMERPLPDVIRELGQKVVNAAHQLANSVPASAAQPAATCIASAAQPATSSSGQLAKKRKREHATAGNSAEPPASSTVEQAAPTDAAKRAQPKPAQRQNKRTAVNNFDSVEQPARKRQDRRFAEFCPEANSAEDIILMS